METAQNGTPDKARASSTGPGNADPELLLRTAESIAAKHGGSTKRPSTPEQREKWRIEAAARRQQGKASQGIPPHSPQFREETGPAMEPCSVPALDPEIVRACLVAVFVTANETVTGAVARRVCSMTRTKENKSGDRQLASELAAAVDITEPRKKLCVETGLLVLTKYQLIGEYFPEVALGLAVVSWGLQITRVFSRLDEMEEKLTRLRAEEPKP